MKKLIISFRIDQWIKNAFVLAPVIFSKHLFDSVQVVTALTYALVFCIVSSGVYLLNDVLDREKDRTHPDKKSRPVASGALPVRTALIGFLVLSLAGGILGFFFSYKAGLFILVYLINNILYSLVLKKIVVLDILLIAVGFVLRVLGGAAVIEVEASVWLIMCTFLLSIFLGFCKRKQELLVLGNQTAVHRAVLGEYNINYLDHMISVVSACTVISYALYTVAGETVEKFHTHNLIYTMPFVLYGVFRYMYNINVLGSRKNTSRIIFTDISLLINILLWLAASVFIIYRGK